VVSFSWWLYRRPLTWASFCRSDRTWGSFDAERFAEHVDFNMTESIPQ
jgi:hypothetical protein